MNRFLNSQRKILMSNLSSNTPESPSTSKAVPRRGIVRGAAWAVPVAAVAVAAPALAVSPSCGPATIDWGDDFTRTATTTGTGTASGGSGVTFDVRQTFGASITPFELQNLTTTTTSLGDFLMVMGRGAGAGGGTTAWQPQEPYIVSTFFTFSEPVTNLTFSIYDIDAEGVVPTQFYHEGILVNAPGVTRTTGSNISGATANGWHYPIAYGNRATDDPAASITYTIPGPITTFQIRLSRTNNGLPPENAGGVLVSGFDFSIPC
jgi:hypothetical protein